MYTRHVSAVQIVSFEPAFHGLNHLKQINIQAPFAYENTHRKYHFALSIDLRCGRASPISLGSSLLH